MSGIVSLLNLKENVLQNDGSLRHGVGLSHKRVLDAISGATAPLALQVDTRYTMIKGQTSELLRTVSDSSLGLGHEETLFLGPRGCS